MSTAWSHGGDSQLYTQQASRPARAAPRLLLKRDDIVRFRILQPLNRPGQTIPGFPATKPYLWTRIVKFHMTRHLQKDMLENRTQRMCCKQHPSTPTSHLHRPSSRRKWLYSAACCPVSLVFVCSTLQFIPVGTHSPTLQAACNTAEATKQGGESELRYTEQVATNARTRGR